MIQTAVVSGPFSGQFLDRKWRPAGTEDIYPGELDASGKPDLLNPDSRKAPAPFKRVVDIYKVRAPETESELIENLQQAQGTPRLTDPSGRPAFLRVLPGPLGEASIRIVGEHGLRRYEEFKRYRSGWDYGRGQRLSPRSVTTLESFVKHLPELAAFEPSLFLTHQGNLQLGWEDPKGNVVEMEFFSDKVEYYFESLNEEGSVGLEALHQLANRVMSTRT